MLLQALQPIFDPTFSAHSFGFRPGKSAHDAVRAAQNYIQAGKDWVVDMDITKFFDRVNHDILMQRIGQTIRDKRVLRLIGKYLKAGIMIEGVVQSSEEGTPQGGPLSPLLANIYLDPLDRELEARGLAHVRLRINQGKSGAGPTEGRKFLGFTLSGQGIIGVASKSIERFKEKVRDL